MNTALPEPFFVKTQEARRLLGGIGHSHYWQLVKDGAIELVPIGRRRLPTLRSLKALLPDQPTSKNA